MRTCLEGCFDELRPQLEVLGCGWQDFLWAVQVRICAGSTVAFTGSTGMHTGS
jgi:hypothetical protein